MKPLIMVKYDSQSLHRNMFSTINTNQLGYINGEDWAFLDDSSENNFDGLSSTSISHPQYLSE
eukprot:Awhi_evm1s2564